MTEKPKIAPQTYRDIAPIDGCAWAWCRSVCRCSAFSTY
jgi:hypothetical protein